jgi:hypothetical protein
MQDLVFQEPELILRWFEAIPESPQESQDQRKEAQETLRKAKENPLDSRSPLGPLFFYPGFPLVPRNN